MFGLNWKLLDSKLHPANSFCNILSSFIVFHVSCNRLLSNEIFSPFTAKSCRRVEHLFLSFLFFYSVGLFTQAFLYFATVGSITGSGLVDLVTTIPNLTSLTLIGFGVDDATAHVLIEVWLLQFWLPKMQSRIWANPNETLALAPKNYRSSWEMFSLQILKSGHA